MPSVTELERLVVTMEARFTGFEKALKNLTQNVNQEAKKVEVRTSQMTGRIEAAFNRLGPRLTSTGKVIFGGALVYGLERFTASLIETVSKIQDTADAIGVSTDALQQWTILAGKAGVSQDDFTSALDRFAKNLGEAQIKGGPLRKLFQDLGVDIKAGTVPAFLQFADGLSEVAAQEQQVTATAKLMGRGSVQLAGFIAQGSAAINEQGNALKRTGAVLSAEMIKKIDDLGDKWTEVRAKLMVTGGNVLSGFADEFSKFADRLQDPEVQSGLRNFGQVLGEVAVSLTKAAPYFPQIAGALAAMKLASTLQLPLPLRLAAGAGGALLGGALFKSPETQIKETKDMIAKIQKEINESPSSILKVEHKTDLRLLRNDLKALQEEQGKLLTQQLTAAEENVKRIEAISPAKRSGEELTRAKAEVDDIRIKMRELLSVPGEAISKIELPKIGGLGTLQQQLDYLDDQLRQMVLDSGLLGVSFTDAATIIEKDLNDQITQTTAKIADLENKIANPTLGTAGAEQARQTLDALNAKADSLRAALKALPPVTVQVDITDLENELIKAQDLMRELAVKDPLGKGFIDAKARVAELTAELNAISPITLEFKKTTLIADLKAAQELVKQLERTTPLGTLNPELEKAQANLLKLQTEFNEISRTPIQLDLQIRRAYLEEQLRKTADTVKDLEKQQSALGTQVSPELAKTKAEFEQITAQVRALSNVPINVNIERAALEKQLHDAQAKLNELHLKDPFDKSINVLQEKIATITAELAKVPPLDVKVGKIDLENQLTRALAVLRQLEASKPLKSLSPELVAAEAEVARIAAELASVSHVPISIDILISKTELEGQLKQAEARVRELEIRNPLDPTLKQLKAEVVDITAKLAAISDVPINVKIDRAGLEQQLTEARARVAELKVSAPFGKAMDDAEARVHNLENLLQSVSKVPIDIKTRIAIVDELKKAQAALDNLRLKGQFGKETDELVAKVADLTAKLENISKVPIDIKTQIDLVDKLREAQAAVDDLRDRHIFGQQMDEAEARVDALIARIESVSKVPVEVNLTLKTNLETELRRLQDLIGQLESQASPELPVKQRLVEVRTEAAGLQAQLDALSTTAIAVPITTHFDRAQLEAGLKQAKADLEALQIKNPFDPGIEAARAKFVAFQIELATPINIPIDAQFDTSGIEAELAQVEADTKKSFGKAFAAVNARAIELRGELAAITKVTIPIDTLFDKAGLEKQLAQVEAIAKKSFDVGTFDLANAKAAELRGRIEAISKIPISIQTAKLGLLDQLREVEALIEKLRVEAPLSDAFNGAVARAAVLRQKLDDLSNKPIDVQINLAKIELGEQLRKAEAALNSELGVGFIKAFNPELSRAKANVTLLRERLADIASKPVTVELRLEKIDLEKQLIAAEAVVTRLESKTLLSPALKQDTARVAELRAEFDALTKVQVLIPVTTLFDKAALERQIAQTKTDIAALEVKIPFSASAIKDANAKVAEVKANLDAVSKIPVDVTIDMQLDKAGLEEQFRQAQDAADKLHASEPFSDAFKQAEARAAAYRTQLQSFSKISIDIQTKIGLTDQIKKAQDALDNLRFKNPLDPGIAAAETELAQLRAHLTDFASKPISIQINLAKVELGAKLREAEAALRRLETQEHANPALDREKAKLVTLQAQLDALSKHSVDVAVNVRVDRAKLEADLKQAKTDFEALQVRDPSSPALKDAVARIVDIQSKLDALTRRPVDIPIEMQLDRAALQAQFKQAADDAARLKLEDPFSKAFKEAEAKAAVFKNELQAISKISIDIQTNIGLTEQLNKAKQEVENLRIKDVVGPVMDRAKAKVVELETEIEDFASKPISVQINLATTELRKQLTETEALIKRLEHEDPLNPELVIARATAVDLNAKLQSLTKVIPISVTLKADLEKQLNDLQKKITDLEKAPLGPRTVNPALTQARNDLIAIRAELDLINGTPISIPVGKNELEQQLVVAKQRVEDLKSIGLFGEDLDKAEADVIRISRALERLSPVTIEIKRTALQSELQKVEAEIARIEKETPFAAYGPALDALKAKAVQLRNELAGISKNPVYIDFRIKRTGIRAGLEEQIKVAREEVKRQEDKSSGFLSFFKEVPPALTESRNRLKELTDQMELLDKATPEQLAEIKVPNEEELKAQIASITADIERLNQEAAKLGKGIGAANPELDAAKARLLALRLAMLAASKDAPRLKLDADIEAGERELETFRAQLKKGLDVQLNVKGLDTLGDQIKKKLDEIDAPSEIQKRIDALLPRLAALKAERAKLPAPPPAVKPVPPKPKGTRTLELTDDDRAELSIIKRTALEAVAAERDRARANNEANASILEGTTSVYDAIRKKIDDNAAAERAAAFEKKEALVKEEDERYQAAQKAQGFSETDVAHNKAHQEILTNIHKAYIANSAEIDAHAREQHIKNLRDEKAEQFKLAEELITLAHSVAAAKTASIVEATQGTAAAFAAERRQIQQEADEQKRAIAAQLDEKIRYYESVRELAIKNKNPEAFKNFEQDTGREREKAKSQTETVDVETHNKNLANIREQRDAEFRAQEDILDAHRATAESETALRVEMAQGTGQQYALEREQANQQADHDRERLAEQRQARLTALNATIDALRQEEDGATKNADLIIRLEQEKIDAKVVASDKEREIEANRQINLDRIREDEYRLKARANEVSDALRGGLEDLGMAAISGSKNFQQAVAQMLRDLGLLIVKLYVIRPLIQAAFGAPGTSGGGFFGSLFGKLLGGGGGFSVADAAASTGFAGLAAGAKGMVFGARGEVPLRRFGKGGVGKAGQPQMAIFSEGSQNEAFVPLPDGRRIPVDLRIPPARNVSRGPMSLVVRNEIYLQGANGDDTIRRISRQAAAEGSQFAISTIQKNFPGMMVKASRDNL